MGTLRDLRLGRRRFLKRAAVVGAAVPMAGGLIAAACSDGGDGSAGGSSGIDYKIREPEPTKAPSSGGASTQATPESAAWKKIDHDHEEGIRLFLQNQETPLTKGLGNQPLASRVENGVRIFDITVEEVDWETIPGGIEKARGYNGMVTGPIIRATEGETVRINVKNNLTESTSVHWHGLVVPNNMDGVGGLTQPEINPGQSYTYEFPLRNFGTHMYHSHHNSTDQVNRGLLGAFIVDPKDPSKVPAYDKEYILVLNDVALGFTINGKGFPATEMLTAKKGQKLMIRWMNEGLMNHPMHLHGMPMLVTAIDGYPLPAPYYCDTIDVAPGNRYDTIVDCTEEGVWAFHCHILSHAEAPSGFFGLTTVLKVDP